MAMWPLGAVSYFAVAGTVISLEDVATLLPIRRDGHSFLELKNAFESVGFDVAAQKASIDDLGSLETPFVAKLDNPDHFIAVMEVNKSGLMVFDGAGKQRLATWKQVSRNFSGKVLVVTSSHEKPLPKFVDRPKKGEAGYSTGEITAYYHANMPGKSDRFVQEIQSVSESSDQRMRILKIEAEANSPPGDGSFQIDGSLLLRTNNPKNPTISIPIKYRPRSPGM